MLSVYVGSLLFGGVLFGASAFHGGDHEGGHGVGDGVDHGHGEGALVKETPHGLSGLPLLSLRFWTFALGTFGLTGALLTMVGAGVLLTPALAGAMGLGAGLGSWRVLGTLARKPVGLLGAADAHVGREGTLLLPVARGQRGKLRLTIGGTANDFLAETESEASLPAGARVLVVGVRGNALLVEGSPALALPEN